MACGILAYIICRPCRCTLLHIAVHRWYIAIHRLTIHAPLPLVQNVDGGRAEFLSDVPRCTTMCSDLQWRDRPKSIDCVSDCHWPKY